MPEQSASEKSASEKSNPRREPLPPQAPWAFSRWLLERTGLLLLTGGLLYVLGLRGFLLIAAAFLLSGVFSYFLLFRVRNAAAGNVERQVGGLRGWFRRRETAEDTDEDSTPSTGTRE